MQPPDTHASQLFQIKALPRLLKTVAKKSIATATQVSSHDPATIVPHTETAQEASASQSAASASLSSSTAAENPVRPVISLASAPPSQRQHHMITHTQTGKLKPKVFISSRHPIPACFIADLVAQRQEPSSVQQALQHLHWIQAMQAEMDALHNNKTWTLVPRQANMNIISSKWVFKIKTRSDGSIKRYKARLVARGFSQQPGLDYDETFSPVIKPSTIRLILTIGLSHGWSVKQLDVSNAFLHRDLQEQVYLAQPPGFEDSSHPDYVCHLHKALYGLKQAPRAWYLKFSNYIQQMGFTRCPYDQSLFYLHKAQTSSFCSFMLMTFF
jgi:histone deacetylase 1/2